MINISFQERSDSLFYPVINDEDTLIDMKTVIQWDSHSKRVFSEPHNYGIDIGSSGITVDRFGNPETKWEALSFHYILGIDLDLDASSDVMAIDSSGILYGFNSDLVLMSGFPIGMSVDPPVLAKNLFGNELVVCCLDRYIAICLGLAKDLDLLGDNISLILRLK